MKTTLTGLLASLLLAATAPALAVTILECKDEDGTITYRDRCPVGTMQAGEKKFYTGSKAGEEAGPDVAVDFYTVPTCDACDVVRKILDEYGAHYSEKNVESNVELQKELQEKSGGGNSLSVPTVIVGETTIIGYNKQSLITSLEEAGFNKGGTPGGALPPKEPATDETGAEDNPFATEDTGGDTSGDFGTEELNETPEIDPFATDNTALGEEGTDTGTTF